ncbi:hypothetical protein AMJ39_06685 [candidate division TA06 bacterium DG_24]|uniref:Sortilin N-terminal domain-containing protein n=3 Tax=Bacteria division TA06 TaxID=1156500 RepID=A0A0S8JJU2_UNCT6|nr:MAG: hypothetical protein AMJ39_06685 [candidate division TA06 bacterium DG_24]KPK68972.1 MAG: hypothetical protein AMJ82_06885 [candidate division TA06 bacterium SM23_40]KPL10086.1 MAG: hypothetical protein AMJ71_04510 [candidate division TA06 bacterium SM1_40]
MNRIDSIREIVLVTMVTGCVAIVPTVVHAQYVWGPTTLLNDPFTLPTSFGTVVADPLDPNTVWAATSHLPDPLGPPEPASGIFKSTDGGETWTQMNDGNLTPDMNVLDIAIDPSDQNIVYAASNVHGVFKTTDGGESWTAKNDGILYKGLSFPEPQWGANAIAIDPSDPNIVYVAVSNVNQIDIEAGAGDHPGFFKSTDGGESWSERNNGLPPRYDPFELFDLTSHTVSVSDILVLPQMPNVVVIGVLDIEANAELLFGLTAHCKGRIFYSPNRAEGNWIERSVGLPSISQAQGSGGVTRVCGSIMLLSAAETGPPAVYASHTGLGMLITLNDAFLKSKSKGVYKWGGGTWTRKSNGLPVVTDEYNDEATNSCAVAVAPVNPSILLVGISASDAGDPLSDRSKVYASRNGGDNWTKNWDQGMSVSPHGYTEANVLFLDINAAQTKAFASVTWNNVEGTAGIEDNGIWRLPPLRF